MSRRGLLIVLVLSVIWLLGALPAQAEDPPEDPRPVATAGPLVPEEGTPSEPQPSGETASIPGDKPDPDDDDDEGGWLPDPRQWAAEVFNQVLMNLLQGIATAIRGLVDAVTGSSLNFIWQTPPAGSYASSTVRTLWGVVQAIANAALALVALWGGFNLIVRDQIGSPYHEAMELFPRLVLGALLANTSLSWGQLAIDANNGLCQAIGQTSLPAWDRADGGTQVLVDVVASLIYLITSLLLLIQMLMRLALIDVLLVVSPVALLCWVLPQTQSWARLWSSLFFAGVFTQFVQVVVMKLGGSLLTDVVPVAPDASLLSFFLGIAVLALTLKIPGLMRNHVDSGLGFVRYVSYRQGAKAIEGPGGGARGR